MAGTGFYNPEIIRKIMADNGLNQEEFANQIGVSQPTVSMWLSGKTSISTQYAQAISNKFKVPFTKFLTDNNNNMSSVDRIPIISWVQAGTWTQMPDYENVAEYREVPSSTPSDWFAMKVYGDSMTRPAGGDSIIDGEIVVVRPYKGEPLSSLNHKIVIAMHNNEATIKELRFEGSKPYLSPWNPAYLPITDLDQVVIIGIVKYSIKDR